MKEFNLIEDYIVRDQLQMYEQSLSFILTLKSKKLKAMLEELFYLKKYVVKKELSEAEYCEYAYKISQYVNKLTRKRNRRIANGN
jgi:hypothetical protein